MTAIIFIVVLAILIFVHELGHFLAAKACKIRVDEFALGFPPRVFGKKYGETDYVLNLIPFGGYVKIFGENPDEESISGPDNERSFVNKNRGLQAIVLSAGVLFNIILAWLLISFGFMFGTLAPVSEYENSGVIKDRKVIVLETLSESPAEKAGLKAGDIIKGVSNPLLSSNPLGENATVNDIQSFISKNSESELVMSVLRSGEIKKISVKPISGLIEDKVAIGISMEEVATVRLSFFKSLWEGGKSTILFTKLTASGLFDLITKAFTGKADFSQISGPVGIAGLVGDAARTGLTNLFNLIAIISINLAVLNFFPFPALDGGRLLFVGIEAIIRRRLNPKIMNYMNGIGFILLLVLMVIVTFKDVVKLF